MIYVYLVYNDSPRYEELNTLNRAGRNQPLILFVSRRNALIILSLTIFSDNSVVLQMLALKQTFITDILSFFVLPIKSSTLTWIM